MGIGVSVGPPRHYEVNSVQVQPLTQSGLYIVECSITAFIRNGPPGYPRERLCDATVTVQAEDAHRWVEGLLDELIAYDPHAMPTERQAILHAMVPALPTHLRRLLLRTAMRRRRPLRQKFRRNKAKHMRLVKQRHIRCWDELYATRWSAVRAQAGVAVVEKLMRDLGEYLPLRRRPPAPPPRPPPHSYVDLKPPALRRFGQTVVDRSDCIKPSPAPPSE